MGKSRDLGFHPNTSVELGFGAGKWDASQLTDQEKEEIRDYATERGFKIETARGMVFPEQDRREASAFWMSWGYEAVAKYPGVEGSFPAWSEPLIQVHYAEFGYLTEADFVASRVPGWEESAAVMVEHNEAAISLEEEERASRLSEVAERRGKIQEQARDANTTAYRKEAGDRLKSESDLIADEHIPALDIRVRELRRELEWAGNRLLEKYAESVLDWLCVVQALAVDFRQSVTREEWLSGSISVQVSRLFSGFQHGTAPALVFNHCEYLLRNELGLSEAMVRAQLSGLAYLLFWREPYLVEAAYLRDKLSTYERLLLNAVRDEPPLDEKAMELLEKTRAERARLEKAKIDFEAFCELTYEIAWEKDKGGNYFKNSHSLREIFERAKTRAGGTPYSGRRDGYDSWRQRFGKAPYNQAPE